MLTQVIGGGGGGGGGGGSGGVGGLPLGATYTYTDLGGEQTIWAETLTACKILNGVWIDLSSMSQVGTVKLYAKIYAGPFQLVEQWENDPVVNTGGMLFIDEVFGFTNSFYFSYTEKVDEGTDRVINTISAVLG